MAHHSQNDTHEHAHEHRGSSVATYIIVALILGVITYLEFAIVEFEIGWLSTGATLFWLVLMSLVKFFFVIWWFMHLKDDETTYSGFFGSGMAIALGTFIVLGVVFTAPSTFNRVRAQAEAVGAHQGAAAIAAAHAEEEGHGGGVTEEELALIESDGYSRPLDTQLDTPRPKNQRVSLTLPAAPDVEIPLLPAPALFGAAADAQAPADTGEAEPGPADTGAAAGSGDEPVAQAADPLDFDTALGAQTYSNCVGCHQSNGAGIAGVFPPLAGHTPTLVAADGGRAYLAANLLYGLQGQIEIDGQIYNGVMPPWGQLSDEQIAAVLNHILTEWGNADLLPDGYTPFVADEIAAARGQDLSANDVYELRQALDLP